MRFKRDRGFGILESVLAMGIIILIIFGAMSYMSYSSKLQSTLADKEHTLLIRNFLREKVDCEKAFMDINANPGLCSAGTYIDVYDDKGDLLISRDGQTKIGNYLARASCPTGDELQFEVKKTADTGDSQEAYNLNQQAMFDWVDPFNGIPFFKKYSSYSSFINFENVPGVYQGKVVDADLNDWFETNYGVRFNYLGPHTLNMAYIVRRNEPPATFLAWMSILCDGIPNDNRLCNDPSPDVSGRWALSSSNSHDRPDKDEDVTFEVVYTPEARNPSWSLLDFDGGEEWTVTAYDANGQVVSSVYRESGDGYGTNTTSNNASITMSMNLNAPKIKRLHFRGEKNIKIFGYGFDNFRTGVATCRPE